jgi:hypothetical protein
VNIFTHKVGGLVMRRVTAARVESCGYVYDGNRPHISVVVYSKDRESYRIELSQADIDVINRERACMDDEFQKYAEKQQQ